MRYRFCFVSNSSSSSSILAKYLQEILNDEVEDIVFETSDQSNEEDDWDEIEKRFEQEREEYL